jgi:methionyl-tRNA synthetase
VRDEAFYDEEETRHLPDGSKKAPTGAPVEWVVEPSYFFKLSAFQDKLLAFYDANPGFIAPTTKRNEMTLFRARWAAISPSAAPASPGAFPVPGDEKHVMYVWLDALVNYLTAAGYPDESSPRYGYWPANVHLVGKEIIRFHAVYWPAFLMAANLPLPGRVFSHGWWTVEGEKMSKSTGNFIDVRPLIDEFGLDTVRFFLLREVPFGNDGDFSRKSLIARTNAELANGIGNLASARSPSLPKTRAAWCRRRARCTEADHALLALAEALPEKVRGRSTVSRSMRRWTKPGN